MQQPAVALQVVLGLVLLQASQEPAEGRTKLLGKAWRSLSAACLLQSQAANSGGAQALAAALLAQAEAAGNLRRKEERVAHHISQVQTVHAPRLYCAVGLSSSSAVGGPLCRFMRSLTCNLWPTFMQVVSEVLSMPSLTVVPCPCWAIEAAYAAAGV